MLEGLDLSRSPTFWKKYVFLPPKNSLSSSLLVPDGDGGGRLLALTLPREAVGSAWVAV